MKKSAIFLALVCFCFITNAQSDEEKKVKKAIESNIEAMIKLDYETVKASWHHDTSASITFISRDYFQVIKGWDSIIKTMQLNIQQTASKTKPDVKLENFKINISGNMAFVVFDRIVVPVVDQSTTYPYNGSMRFRDHEMLLKKDGQWKTHTRIITLPQSYTGNINNIVESDLNNAGYNLITANRLNEAIEVFKLNVKLYPNSWNTYDSLGEAYALAGDKKMAIENYEKSIKLNPKSEFGPQTLQKLKQDPR